MPRNPICPNKSLPEWKQLVEELGDERDAYRAFFRHRGRGGEGIPTSEQARGLLYRTPQQAELVRAKRGERLATQEARQATRAEVKTRLKGEAAVARAQAQTTKVRQAGERAVALIQERALRREKIAATRAAETGIKQGRAFGQAEGELIGAIRQGREMAPVIRKLREAMSNVLERRADANAFIDVVKEMYDRNEIPKNIALQIARIAAEGRATQRSMDTIMQRIDNYLEKKERQDLMTEGTKNYRRWNSSQSVSVEARRQLRDLMGGMTKSQMNALPTEQLRGLINKVNLTIAAGRAAEAQRITMREAEVNLLTEKAIQDTYVPSYLRTITPPSSGEIGVAPSAMDQFVAQTHRLAQEGNKRLDLATLSMNAQLELFDGFKVDGFHQGMKDEVDYSHGNYLNRRDNMLKSASDIVMEIPEIHREKVMVYLIGRQVGGTEKLQAYNPELYSESNMSNNNNFVRTRYAQQVARLDGFFAETKPLIDRVMADVYNRPVGEVQDYFPFMRDFNEMYDMSIEDRLMSDEYRRRTQPERGITETRKPAATYKPNLDIVDVMTKYINESAYLIEMADTLQKYNRVVGSDSYRQVAGPVITTVMRDYMDTLARNGGMNNATDWALADRFRKNSQAAVLSLRISTFLTQFTSLGDTIGEIGPVYTGSGLYAITTDPMMRKLVMQMPELRDRMGYDPAFVEKVIFQQIAEAGMFPLKQADKVVAMSTAAGAYQKYMAEHNLPITETLNREGMLYAQRVVQRSQSVAFPKDMPQALTRGATTGQRWLDRMIFYLGNFNMQSRWSAFRNVPETLMLGNRQQKVLALNRATWKIVSLAVEVGIATQLTKWLYGSNDDDERDNFLKQAALRVAGVNPLMSPVMSSLVYNKGSMTPLGKAESELTTSLQDVYNLTISDKYKREETQARKSWLAAINLVNLGGMALGLPTSQVAQLAKTKVYQQYPVQRGPSSGTRMPGATMPGGTLPAATMPR